MADESPPLRIVIADRNAVVRAGVKSFLHEKTSIRVVADTGTAADALPLVVERNATVLVIDVAMPDARVVLTGLQSTGVKTIALVDAADKEALNNVLDLIDGLVLKQSHLGRLSQAIQLVSSEGHSIRRDRARERHAGDETTKNPRSDASSRRDPAGDARSDD